MQIPKHLQNGVADRESRHVYVLLADGLWPNCVLARQNAGLCKPVTVFAVLLERDDSDKNLVLHEEAVRGLLEGYEDLECAEFGAPGVSALAALVIEEA